MRIRIVETNIDDVAELAGQPLPRVYRSFFESELRQTYDGGAFKRGRGLHAHWGGKRVYFREELLVYMLEGGPLEENPFLYDGEALRYLPLAVFRPTEYDDGGWFELLAVDTTRKSCPVVYIDVVGGQASRAEMTSSLRKFLAMLRPDASSSLIGG